MRVGSALNSGLYEHIVAFVAALIPLSLGVEMTLARRRGQLVRREDRTAFHRQRTQVSTLRPMLVHIHHVHRTQQLRRAALRGSRVLQAAQRALAWAVAPTPTVCRA
ncbi:hypothetical protein DBR42_11795 [Pelomonas sp. HMWF004]|nr:hypothetical protein DBR42_11795 [Pelomonas sp. HMWF004]